jgi:hypothetical protein
VFIHTQPPCQGPAIFAYVRGSHLYSYGNLGYSLVNIEATSGPKLKQDATRAHSRILQDRRRAREVRESRRRFFRCDFCTSVCRLFPTLLGAICRLIFQHLHATDQDQQRAMEQCACLQNVCRHWDFTTDRKRATINRWHDYARDVRFYSNAVEFSSRECSAAWSLALPVPPGAIFYRQAPH